MTDLGKQLSRTHDLSGKVAQLFQKRAQTAQQRFSERVQNAYAKHIADLVSKPMSPWDIWTDWSRYAVDFAQRSTLFWDAIRARGNQYVEHNRQGMPPVLHFDYEVVLDARTFDRPVNYAMLRIVPPQGVTVDPKRRPYVIIDPRAGHGPGIGGFKDDSQVGVALREGHPVYFVMFYPQPEPGQTLLDVTEAERKFVHRVRELHPDSPKPVIVGNCQGGWAAMMLAAADPDEMGPIVINGAPMSYWGGASGEEQAENPMRYAGGALGGTWLASLTADLGNGVFDGAHLVQNFENLNPSNTFWDKYYNLFANVDTETPRFLEFERWWGGFFLMNREEIEWITQKLFVGNDLWSGKMKSKTGELLDLKRIKSPIILFASMGDNITPAAAGVQLGGRRVRLDRRDQGTRSGHRRPPPQEHRTPRHLCVRRRGEEGARADRLGAEVDRGAAARAVRHGDRRDEGRRRQAGVRRAIRRAPARGGRRARQPHQARRREAVRGGRPRSRSSTSAPTSCSRSRSCRRCRTSTPPSSGASSIRCASSAGRSPT